MKISHIRKFGVIFIVSILGFSIMHTDTKSETAEPAKRRRTRSKGLDVTENGVTESVTVSKKQSQRRRKKRSGDAMEVEAEAEDSDNDSDDGNDQLHEVTLLLPAVAAASNQCA